MKVSVIIPIRRGENTDNIIASILSSDFKDYEIIVVDEGLERSRQRNIGIDRAKGEYLLILDSDQRVSSFLIGECVRKINCGIDAIYIQEIIKTKGLFAYIRNWERQFYTATPIDVVRFVRRENCPKFDEAMVGPEDSDWDRQIEGIRSISIAPLYHYDNVGVIDFFYKKAYYCKSMKRFAERNPDDKILNFWWRCFGVFVEQGKWKRFLSRPDLAIAVLTLIFVRGVIYLWQK